jgi:hypothetical protein
VATNFPASLDSLTNPTSSDSLNSPSHSAQHANSNDAIEALQAKVGVDSSAVTTSLDYKVAQLEAISHGKILQVVRGTDTTERTTTSTSFVDANISVTITPTSTDSDILLIWLLSHRAESALAIGKYRITDSSNNSISGAETALAGLLTTTRNYASMTVIGFDSPATTSATTYKGRFSAESGATVEIDNDFRTGQLFALEISA